MLHWSLFPSKYIMAAFATWLEAKVLLVVFHFLIRTVVWQIFPLLVISPRIFRGLKFICLIRFFGPTQSIIPFVMTHRHRFIKILNIDTSSCPNCAVLSCKTNLSFQPRTRIEIFCKFELFTFFWISNISILILSIWVTTWQRLNITIQIRSWRGIFAKKCVNIHTYFSYLSFFTKKILLHYCRKYVFVFFVYSFRESLWFFLIFYNKSIILY